MTINMLVLTPLLKAAIDRHGAFVAELAEASDGNRMLWAAHEHVGTAIPHADAGPDKRLFAAELLAEAGMMFLVAAKMLQKEAGK